MLKLRFGPVSSCLLILWIFTGSSGMAQERLPLQVQNKRLRVAEQAERQAMAQHDSLGLAQAYYQYGRTYVFAGDYRSSQHYFLRALQLLEPRGDSFELSRIYVRLSENEGRLGRFTDALRYADLAKDVAHRIHSSRAMALSYGVLARMHELLWSREGQRNRTEYTTALVYYRQKLPIYAALNDTLGIAETNLEVGTLLTKTKDPQALPYLKKALTLFDLLHKNNTKVNGLLHLAEAYLTFNKPQLAWQMLQEAQAVYTANQVDEYDTILGLEKAYVRYFQTTNQWREALRHLEKVNELERSHLLSDREAAIARLNVEYETEKKEILLKTQRSLLALRTENLRTQQHVTVAVLVLLLMAITVSFLFFQLNRKNKRISRQNAALVNEQNHRVKNNLQVVSSLLSLQSKRLADEAAKQAIDESRLRIQSMVILHRRLYDNDRLAEVGLDEFVQEVVAGVLRAYGAISVETRCNMDTIILPADKALPLGLIVNELTTNACKYAFTGNEAPLLRIDCHRENNKIQFRLADNGAGFANSDWTNKWPKGAGGERAGTSPVLSHRTFGMSLIAAQVKQLMGAYWFDFDQGTVFTLEFDA